MKAHGSRSLYIAAVVLAGAMRMNFCALAGLAFLLFMLGTRPVEATTYYVDQTIGAGSVVGTIETDGATILNASDITSWNLTLNGAGGVSYGPLTPLNSSILFSVGSSRSPTAINDVTADAAHLYFNFSGGDGGYLLFQASLFSGQNYYCLSSVIGTCFQGASVAPEAYNSPSFQNVSLSGDQIIGTATPLPAALPLFATGLGGLGLLGWRRKRGAQAV